MTWVAAISCALVASRAAVGATPSSKIEHSAHHRDTTASDKGRGNDPRRLVGTRLEQARPAHVDALGDLLCKLQVGLRAQLREQADQGDIGSSGRGILGDAVQRREHAALDVGAAVSRRDIEVNAGDAIPRQMPSEDIGARLRRRKRLATREFDKEQGRAAARDARLMVACLDVLNRDAQA